jgi:hypothetical protein
VAHYVSAIELKNEPVLFRNKTLLLTLRPYYYSGNPLISIPDKPFDYNFYKDEIKDTTELNLLIESCTHNCKSFLWINVDDDCIVKRELTNAEISAYFKHNYTITIDTIFNGKSKNDFLQVRRLIRK